MPQCAPHPQADGAALTDFLDTLFLVHTKPRDIAFLPSAAAVTFSTSSSKVAQATQQKLVVDGTRELPSQIPPTVEDITVNSKKLPKIPQSILQQTALRRLDLGNNAITSIPESFSALKLAVLDLSNNRLVELPAFACLPTLRRVDVSGNLIGALPSLAAMPGLEYLDVSGNRLTYAHIAA